MSKHASTEELERQAEHERAKIAETAEELRSRLTPGQLIDEMLDYVKGSDASGMLRNLKGQVRDNPLALAMVGAGMAWLVSGRGYNGGSHGRYPEDQWDGDSYGADADLFGDSRFADRNVGDDSGQGLGDRLASATRGAKDAAGSSLHGAGDAARGAYGSAAGQARSAVSAASDRIRDAGQSARHGAAGLSHRARHYAERSGNMVGDLMEREPLAIGALALAVGAAIGAGLPSTRLEDEYLGPTRDHLKDDAEGMLRKGAEQARSVAGKAAGAARTRADREGLVPGDKPLAEKGASVARAAADEVRRSVPKGSARNT